jgi:hypothetical protein
VQIPAFTKAGICFVCSDEIGKAERADLQSMGLEKSKRMSGDPERIQPLDD